MSNSQPTGLVLLRDNITLVRESRERRLVLSNNNNTSQLDLILFLKNDIPERIISVMIQQEAFTYDSLKTATGIEKGSIERVIQWLQERGFIKLWGKRYNPAAPHTKIWLIDGGNQDKATKLKRRTI